MTQTTALKDNNNNKLRKQINGKCTADEKFKNITAAISSSVRS
jgi:hypothetical protein